MRAWEKVAAVVVAVAAIAAGIWALAWSTPTHSGACGTSGSPTPWSVTDLTPQLGGTFSPGAIQSFGSNGTEVWVGGVGSYNSSKDRSFSSPLLARLGGPGGATPTNLTTEIEPYFHDGGVFVPASNGSGWLVVGEAGWGPGGTQSAVVYWHDGIVDNLSSLFVPYFAGRGVFIAAWNGSAWLIGGNSSAGAALVSLTGSTVVDLTPLLHRLNTHGWVQMLGWNGTAWMVGGYGILAAYAGGKMVDLWPLAPFTGGGIYGLDWNGHSWLISGSPTRLALWDGNHLTAGPMLPSAFNAWVNVVVSADGGWVVAGAGYLANGSIGPELVWLGSTSSGPEVDMSGQLPASFAGGQVQFGGLANAYTAPTILLVGQGGVRQPTQQSHGAVAELTLGCR